MWIQIFLYFRHRSLTNLVWGHSSDVVDELDRMSVKHSTGWCLQTLTAILPRFPKGAPVPVIHQCVGTSLYIKRYSAAIKEEIMTLRYFFNIFFIECYLMMLSLLRLQSAGCSMSDVVWYNTTEETGKNIKDELNMMHQYNTEENTPSNIPKMMKIF